MKKLISAILICAMTALCTCVSVYAEITEEDIFNAFAKENPSDKKLEEILSVTEIPSDKIIDKRLVHKWYLWNNRSILNNIEKEIDEMETDFSGKLSKESIGTIWLIPTIDNGNIIEYLYGFNKNDTATVDGKTGLYFGTPYPIEKFAAILNSKDIGHITDIKSVSMANVDDYFITYIKTDNGEYFVPLKDIAFCYYDENGEFKNTDLPVKFAVNTLYDFSDFIAEYRKFTADCLRHRAESKDEDLKSNGDNQITVSDDDGNTISMTEREYFERFNGKPTETPEPTEKPTASPKPTVTPTATATPQPTAKPDCSSWAEEDIENAVSKKILPQDMQSGYTKLIDRADFCRIAYNMLDISGKAENVNSGTHFDDISMKEIYMLSGMGIINGKGENKFAPNDNITREEAAAILSRMVSYLKLNLPEQNGASYSDDGEISDWAKKNVYDVKKLGVMQGVDGNKFDPKSGYTKEQAIVTIMRVMKNIK